MHKMKIYLDTNTIIDFFINETKVIKNKEDARIPSKFQFMTESKEKIEFITSFLTKAEVSRELVSAFHLNEEDIIKVDTRTFEYVERVK